MKLIAGAVTLFVPAIALACAPAPPRGLGVDIANETALIVWDGAAQKETFVRSASFRTTEAKAFGFLVPTPHTPELSEVNHSVFEQLYDATLPELVMDEGISFDPSPVLSLLIRGRMEAAPPGQVRVLDRKHVAGYDAVVLAADEAGALATWLRDNGFDDRPALTEWLQPYVAQHWTVTAFKVGGADTQPSTADVRMTFSTPRPFFPYREPSDQADHATGPRLLRLFVVADQRMDATLSGKPWPGKAIWADALPLPVPGVDKPAGLWLTKLEDESTPRHGTEELYLEPAAKQEHVHPQTHVDNRRRIPVPIDLMAIATGIAAWSIVRRRRRA